MRKSRRIVITAASAAAAAGMAVPLLAGAASAATVQQASLVSARVQPAVASALVELGGGYEQYARLQALQGFGPGHGSVSYTNFQYADPGSHVWAPVSQADALTFTYNHVNYAHVLNGGLVLKAVSPTQVKFSGTGEYAGTGTASSPQDSWKISGDINGAKVTFTITYLTGNPGYVVNATGTIAANGSASGTATSSQDQALTWNLPAGAFQQVLHYTAPVRSDAITVKTQDATVSFVIPAGQPFAGDTVTWAMHNGGSPAADTWSQSVNGGGAASEQVEAGRIQILR